MVKGIEPPSKTELEGLLGSALPLWDGILELARKSHAPLDSVWKPSKTAFGRMCLLQQKKRTLLYLIPENGEVRIAIVLGERAFQLAMASSLPEAIKTLLLEAKPYVEGRGIRFPSTSQEDLPMISELLRIKTARP